MTNKIVNEGVRHEDLKGLVLDIVSIDQYTPKVGSNEENVVLAFTVKQIESAAHDLSNFIETSPATLLDVDVSQAPDVKGDYIVFVEFERNKDLFDNIKIILDDVSRITSEESVWQFTAYKLPEPRPFDSKRFARDVISSPEEYDAKWNRTEADEVKERLDFMIKY